MRAVVASSAAHAWPDSSPQKGTLSASVWASAVPVAQQTSIHAPRHAIQSLFILHFLSASGGAIAHRRQAHTTNCGHLSCAALCAPLSLCDSIYTVVSVVSMRSVRSQSYQSPDAVMRVVAANCAVNSSALVTGRRQA